jgi:hypothetical protein
MHVREKKKLLPQPLDCLEGEHEAVGEGGGHRADVIGEEQAAEEVAVEGLGEVRAEEHLVGAAALRLDVPHVGVEILVAVVAVVAVSPPLVLNCWVA